MSGYRLTAPIHDHALYPSPLPWACVIALLAALCWTVIGGVLTVIGLFL